MSILDDSVEALPRRTMTLFYLVDVSGSMRGAKIGAVNDAIRTTLPIINDISSNNADAEIKIAVLTFSNGAGWIYNNPVNAEDFEWVDQQAGGGTDLGEACRELEKKLHKVAGGGWMGSGSGSFAPTFILLSDGGPTDDFDSGVNALKQNGWFKAGIKIAIAVGEDADENVLAKFTGNIERVIQVHDVETLKTVIRTVSITSSQVGSSSTNGAAKTKEEQVTETLHEQLAEENCEIGKEIAANYSPDEFD